MVLAEVCEGATTESREQDVTDSYDHPHCY